MRGMVSTRSLEREVALTDRGAELDKMAVEVADVGDGLAPGFLYGRCNADGSGGNGALVGAVDIGRGEGDFAGKGSALAIRCLHSAREIYFAEFQGGKPECGRTGVEFPIGAAFMQEPGAKTVGCFVMGERSADI